MKKLLITLSDGIEGEVSKEDEMSSLSVSDLKVERFVGLLVPVGQPQSDVERRRTEHQQVVAQ